MVAVAAIVLLSLLSWALYMAQAGGQAPQLIGGTSYFAAEFTPYSTLNALPPDSRIYSEGFATPYYVLPPIRYHTWCDRSPLGAALAGGGPAGGAAWLRDNSYSHVVLDWNMLARWMSPGNYGYDPNVTLETLHRLAEEHLMLLEGQDPADPVLVYQVKSD